MDEARPRDLTDLFTDSVDVVCKTEDGSSVDVGDVTISDTLCRRRNRFHTGGFFGSAFEGLEEGVEGDVDFDDGAGLLGLGLGCLGLEEKSPDVRTG